MGAKIPWLVNQYFPTSGIVESRPDCASQNYLELYAISQPAFCNRDKISKNGKVWLTILGHTVPQTLVFADVPSPPSVRLPALEAIIQWNTIKTIWASQVWFRL